MVDVKFGTRCILGPINFEDGLRAKKPSNGSPEDIVRICGSTMGFEHGLYLLVLSEFSYKSLRYWPADITVHKDCKVVAIGLCKTTVFCTHQSHKIPDSLLQFQKALRLVDGIIARIESRVVPYAWVGSLRHD